MAYYTALINEWATLTGTTAQKMAAVNAMTVPGPNVDVAVSKIVATLMLDQAFLTLSTFANSATNGNATHDAALNAAKMLMAVINTPNAPQFQMSNATIYGQVKGMLDAILAQETALAGSTGITQTVHDGLMALAATTIPWWQANGYTSPFNPNDLVMAGNLT